MARHGGGPAPRAAIPGRGPSTSTAAALVALVGVLAVVVTLACLSVLGVPLLPREQVSAATPVPSSTPTVDTVALAASPAQKAITALLGPSVAVGWTAAGSASWSGGTPFDAACGRPSVDAVLSGSRVYTAGRTQVVLTVSAFSAGSGAVAMRDWAARLAACSAAPVTVTASPSPSSDAFVASVAATSAQPGATAVFWRRGDVVAVIAVPSPGAPGMAGLAALVDPALVRALTGVCADLASTVDDAVRSPWVSRDQFVGLASPIPVAVTPSPTPAAPAGVTPVPVTWSPTPLPSVSLPVRPADPVWPADLPNPPVPSPVPPSVLAPAPSLSLVPSRAGDPVGPGCGWAFTGQAAPVFDAGDEAALAQGRVTQATEDLAAAQSAWQSNVVAYWQAVADYTAAAQAYTAYASSVRDVARAWDRITAQRQAYADAVDAYNRAVSAREQFLLDQAAAQSAYDDAVAACEGASPTDSPSASTSPTSSPTAATPSASDSTGSSVCPPAEPPILTQLPPTLPPVPTPPPDPRPTG